MGIDENGITETMKSLSIPLQYLVAAALEVTDVNIFKPSGFTMGMNIGYCSNANLLAITAIIRKEALYINNY
ncbi:LytR family transcriptional regulator [Staphylococcus aureus]|uniref:LytR family transcriptional regulator n=1 Tax=Staphylococcus aureus TaxID=1280 RepID=A0A380EI58_STAAU|nr:LytR family transcriptional regulator [Staphylococcus aureus]